jgi:hypothetical protein
MNYRNSDYNRTNKSLVWTPMYLLVDASVLEHPKTLYIKRNCVGAQLHIIDNISDYSDKTILQSITSFSHLSDNELALISRRSLLLTSGSEVFQSMSVGHVEERCCYNFLKIIPYKGTCQASCGYCWFQDEILIPRVNVSFVDNFIDMLQMSPHSDFDNTVFTLTHYKTDCLCLEPITGIIRDISNRSNELRGAHIQLLTKLAAFDFLYNAPVKNNLIICFTIK